MTEFSLLELKKGLWGDRHVRAPVSTWKALEARLLALAASGASSGAPTEDSAAAGEVRAALIRKAAQVSAAGAARAEARANAKLAAKVSAQAVKAALADAAAQAGRHGRTAKTSIAAEAGGNPKQPSSVASVASSVASSDTDEGWHVVPREM